MIAWLKRWSVFSPQTFFLRALLIITAALLPVLLALAVLGYLYSEAERRVIEARRDDIAANAALIIEREVAERISALQALASAYGEVSADPEKFHQIAKLVALRLEEAIVLLDRGGAQLISSRFPYGQALPRREDMTPINPVFEKPVPYVSDIIIGTVLGVPLVIVSVPVTMNGKIDLALSATVSSENLNRALLEAGMPKGWIAALIDRRGLFIARTEGGPAYIGKPARPELIRVAAETNKTGTFSNVTHEGVQVESSFQKSLISGWTVVVAVPTSILYESFYRTLWIIGAIVLLALLTALLFAALAGRSVVFATQALQSGALALGRGDGATWSPRGIVEFDDVGKALVEAQSMLRERDSARAELSRTATLLEAIIKLTPDLVYVKDRDSRTILTNPATLTLYGKELSEVKGRGAIDWHPKVDEVERIVNNDRIVMARGESMQFEEPFTGVNGTRIFLSTKTPWRNEAGEIIGIVGVSTDITERERRAQQMEFVMRELSHRSKNLLTIIQSIARQTAKQSGNIEDFHSSFDNRIQALATLHDLLIRHNWEGAGLDEVVKSQLRAFADSERVRIEGPNIVLRPDVAQVLAMAFHELATNATKYGALADGGTVNVRWRVESLMIHLEWIESGGPKVTAPVREGFGSTVLKRVAANLTDAQIEYTFGREGVSWRLVAPLSTLTAGDVETSVSR